MEPILVRAAEPGDAEACESIHAHYVAGSHATFDVEPMGTAGREVWIRSANAPGLAVRLVAVCGDRVVGWAASGRVRPKAAYQRSAEVGVYVAPDALGGGIGTALLDGLLQALRAAGAHRAYAVVALPNPASEALFARAGFARCGVMSEAGRKFGRWWDVAWFELAL